MIFKHENGGKIRRRNEDGTGAKILIGHFRDKSERNSLLNDFSSFPDKPFYSEEDVWHIPDCETWIARADVARFMIDLAEADPQKHVRKVVAITTSKKGFTG